ncbi:MAG: hypothetical protein JWN60_1131, partial [Acidobacteria bacterium]|nr:hypothetical protein [Acidobacteriota bacterium]
ARFIEVVVFPTPPFWFATAIIFPILFFVSFPQMFCITLQHLLYYYNYFNVARGTSLVANVPRATLKACL